MSSVKLLAIAVMVAVIAVSANAAMPVKKSTAVASSSTISVTKYTDSTCTFRGNTSTVEAGACLTGAPYAKPGYGVQLLCAKPNGVVSLTFPNTGCIRPPSFPDPVMQFYKWDKCYNQLVYLC